MDQASTVGATDVLEHAATRLSAFPFADFVSNYIEVLHREQRTADLAETAHWLNSRLNNERQTETMVRAEPRHG